jgi:hypothetical protein
MPEMKRPNWLRTKRFTLKPMSTEEAILQMDLLGHNFLYFPVPKMTLLMLSTAAVMDITA